MRSFYSSFILSLLTLSVIVSCESKEPEQLTSVTLDKKEITLVRGESEYISAEIDPEDFPITEFYWKSNDDQIATVDVNGKITAIYPGNTIITAHVNDQSATCSITVKELPIESITLSEEELELKPEETARLTAVIAPEEATTYSVTWSSEDNSIATIDVDGNVKAIAPGKTRIVAECAGIASYCNIKVIKISKIKVGDYYYSDGTYSTNLDPQKTPIGLVFWVGDPTEDDASLKRDHPECVNGLVVALNGEKGGCWQSKFKAYESTVGKWISQNVEDYFSITTKTGTKDNLNKTVGYNNTKAIELFNAAEENANWPVETVQAVVAYREEVPAPATSSGWYQPSAKELFLLCAGEYKKNIWNNKETLVENRDLINSIMETIPGASPLSEGYYWSCSEFDQNRTFDIYFHSCFVDMPDKNNRSGLVRCILAF